jgi:hypothetical protein
MARQRFIWPDIWKDPTFGRLTADEQVFFIGCFSIADDEGRLNADPAFLRGELFTYKDLTLKRVQAIRDNVVRKCTHVHLYSVGETDYIALLKWHEYQRPKYAKASKLPDPFPQGWGNDGGSFHENGGSFPESGATGRAGQDWIGKGRIGQESADEDSREERRREIARMLAGTNDADELSEATLMAYAVRLPVGAVAKVRESGATRRGKVGVGWFINALKSELEERAVA